MVSKTTPSRSEKIINDSMVNNIVSWLLTGANESDIKATIEKRKNNITDIFRNLTNKEIEDYIEIARAKVVAMAKVDVDYELSRAMLQYDNLYMKLYMNNDFDKCSEVLAKRCKLLGIGDTNKIQQTGSQTVEIVHTYKELGNRTDAALDMKKFGEEKPPFPLG